MTTHDDDGASAPPWLEAFSISANTSSNTLETFALWRALVSIHAQCRDWASALPSASDTWRCACKSLFWPTSTHGTGCSLAAALATRLGRGDTPEAALTWATDWLHESIAHGADLFAAAIAQTPSPQVLENARTLLLDDTLPLADRIAAVAGVAEDR